MLSKLHCDLRKITGKGAVHSLHWLPILIHHRKSIHRHILISSFLNSIQCTENRTRQKAAPLRKIDAATVTSLFAQSVRNSTYQAILPTTDPTHQNHLLPLYVWPSVIRPFKGSRKVTLDQARTQFGRYMTSRRQLIRRTNRLIVQIAPIFANSVGE